MDENCGLQESHTYCGMADRFLTAANILPFIRVMDELLTDQSAPLLTPANFFVPARVPQKNLIFWARTLSSKELPVHY